MLRIAMLSKWHVHADGYARQFRECGCEITCVWDEEPQRGADWAKALGVDFVADLDALLAREDVDAVCVCTPTTMHREVMLKCAAAKKHIFTEKALATTVADCDEIAKAVREAGITFTISMPFKSGGTFRYIKKLLADGALGKISYARFRNGHNGVSGNWLPAYWFDGTKSGGGAMMDLGCHPVYTIADLLGKPKRVTAVFNQLYGTGLDENASCTVEFESGAIGVMETSFLEYGAPEIVEVYGTDGCVVAVGANVIVKTKKTDEFTSNYVVPGNMMKGREGPIPLFVKACEDGTGSPEGLSLDDARALTEILQNAYIADETGKAVIL